MSTDFSSCKAPKPLVELEGGTARAAILNYNIPSSTTFRVKNYITVTIPDEYWNDFALKAESDHPHAALNRTPKTTRDEPAEESPKRRAIGSQLRDILKKPVRRRLPEFDPSGPVEEIEYRKVDPFEGNLKSAWVEMAHTNRALAPILFLHQPEQYFASSQYYSAPVETFQKRALEETGLTEESSLTSETAVDLRGRGRIPYYENLGAAETYLGTSVAELNANAAYGKLPAFRPTLYGNLRTDYVANPGTTARPTLVIIEEYEVASYLGDYGAGKTIKTFSLLPGEKTSISIKTFRTTQENKSKTENILDSFSEQSANTLEGMINDELGTSSSASDATSTGFSSTENWAQQGSMSGSAGGSIGLFSAKGSVSGSLAHSDTDVNTNTSNSTRANTTNGLKKSMDRHVAQSESARKHDVNTETQQSTSTTTGEENALVREIQNINHSRVLNFVFRELCQEYITVTYLNDVSFGFTKGYLGDGSTVKLDNLEGLLKSVLRTDKQVAEIKARLIDELANVYDYEGTRRSFVERKDEEIASVVDPKKPVRKNSYFRKNSKLAQSWDASGKTVKGIILDVSRRILTTDAVIVEALLGQGEALDCYNQRLQDAAANRADFENASKEQAIDIIDKIKTPNDKANLYKKVFGTDPQTVITENKK